MSLGDCVKHELLQELEARKDEEHKYGIYFNDEYDYMSHLRDVSSFRGSLEPNDQFRIGQAASEMLLESLSVVVSSNPIFYFAPSFQMEMETVRSRTVLT